MQESEQTEEFRREFHERLVRNTLKSMLVFFSLFVIVKLIICNARLSALNEIEAAHLTDLSKCRILSEQTQISTILTFIDSSTKLISVSAASELITANIAGISLLPILFVCTFTQTNNTVYYGNSTLAATLNFRNFQRDNTEYVFESREEYGIIFDLICGYAGRNLLCVARQTQLPKGQIRFSSMPKTADGFQVSADMVAALLGGNEDAVAISNALNRNIKMVDLYSKQHDSLFVVGSGEGLSLLGLEYFFAYSQISFEVINSLNAYKSIQKSGLVEFAVLVVSNATFLARVAGVQAQCLEDIEWTGKVILVIVIIFIFLVRNSGAIVESTMMPSLTLIERLCDLTKAKDEKEFWKLCKSQQPEMFGFLRKYFQHFLWAYRLQGVKNMLKYKRLLLEGLEQIKHIKFAPVLKFIYSELIYLEKLRIIEIRKLSVLAKRRVSAAAPRIKSPKIEISPVERPKKKPRNQTEIEEDLLMKNIGGVRFSTEIQTVEIDQGLVVRVKKMSMPEDLIEEEQHYDDMHSFRTIDSSETKREILILHDDNEIHDELNFLKFDEEKEGPKEEEQGEEDVYRIPSERIASELSHSYEIELEYYRRLIELGVRETGEKYGQDLEEHHNALFELRLNRCEVICQKLEHQVTNGVGIEERGLLEQLEDVLDYSQFAHYISGDRTERAQLVQMKIKRLLSCPVSYKSLQDLCHSYNEDTRMNARHLFAEECSRIQPHLDLEVIHRSYLNLQESSTASFKMRVIGQMVYTLEANRQFKEQVKEMEMIQQYYNMENKKFYFITTSNSTYTSLTGFLVRLYAFISPFDLIQVYHLTEEDAQVSEHSKPLKIEEFVGLFEARERQKSSSKMISKKLVAETFFSSILGRVQEERVHFCKYLVVLLGAEQGESASCGETEESSSYTNTYRANHQKLHQDITRQLSKGYFHVVLAGHHLNNHHSKHFRIRQYIKLCPTLLEVDLDANPTPQQAAQLQAFLK